MSSVPSLRPLLPLLPLLLLLASPAPAGGAPATLVRLASAPADLGAMCLDGSAPALYVREASPGNPWIVAIDGGGWCYNESSCYDRSLTPLGSSDSWPAQRDGLGIESDNCTANPVFCAFNVALIPYCDGMSFMGSRSDPIVFAPNASFSASLFARGVNILDATLNFLVRNTSFARAPQVIVDGCSAGAYNSLQHLDRVAAALPPAADVRGVADAGVFVDAATVTGDFYYRSLLQYYFPMHNASAGAHPDCLASRPAGAAWQCGIVTTAGKCPQPNPPANPAAATHQCPVHKPRAVPFLRHPVFAIQSAFDSYQLGNVFAPVWLPGVDASWAACANSAAACSAEQTNALLYSWLPAMKGGLAAAGLLGPGPGTPRGPHGLFLHSCFTHCQWGEMHQIFVGGVSMYDAFVAFATGASGYDPNSTAYQHVDCASTQCNPTC